MEYYKILKYSKERQKWETDEKENKGKTNNNFVNLNPNIPIIPLMPNSLSISTKRHWLLEWVKK